MHRLQPRAAVPLAVGLLLVLAPAALAQGAGPDRSCTLTLQPTDSTESVSRKVGEETYVTHIRNGMRWLCDPATMTADSAVQYDSRHTVVMIGSVHYRDTIRDLRSRRLTYFQADDRVLAEDSVRLRQLETGSVLRGPRVVFFNAVRGQGATRTVATRRSRMRIPAPGDTTGDPFRVVADTAVLLGEREAEARGDVVVRREELTARGGFARFAVGDGSGFLTRSPSVEGEDFRLTGDTVRIAFDGSELRSVRSVGRARLIGEEMNVRAPTVEIHVTEERVDELWAFGDSLRPGTARALSAEQEIHGDSLHFAFDGGRISSITAVGRALAMEARPADTTGAAPAAGDSVRRPAAGRPPDRAAAPAPPADTAPAADTAAADSAATGEDSPRPDPGLRRNWIAGDTVRAFFSPAREAGADSLGRTPGPPADTAEAGAPPADSAGTGRGTIERLVAIANARSFYRIRREDGGARPGGGGASGSGRPSLNYVIGGRITIRFRSGRPLSVTGERAIGVFLDPVEGDTAAVPPPGAAPADTTAPGAAPEDTTAPGAPTGGAGAPDSAAADTARPVRAGRGRHGGGSASGRRAPGAPAPVHRAAGVRRRGTLRRAGGSNVRMA